MAGISIAETTAEAPPVRLLPSAEVVAAIGELCRLLDEHGHWWTAGEQAMVARAVARLGGRV